MAGSPRARGWVMSRARSSASSRPGTWVRQPGSSCQPPWEPRRAEMGTLAALRASMSRWTVRWETSRRSESSRLVTRPLA